MGQQHRPNVPHHSGIHPQDIGWPTPFNAMELKCMALGVHWVHVCTLLLLVARLWPCGETRKQKGGLQVPSREAQHHVRAQHCCPREHDPAEFSHTVWARPTAANATTTPAATGAWSALFAVLPVFEPVFEPVYSKLSWNVASLQFSVEQQPNFLLSSGAQ